MKNYHPIGKPFRFTAANGEVWILVARECETIHDKQWDEDFRKTCVGCVFCRLREKYCSGHTYFKQECLADECKNALCSPQYRTDGRFIHYKRVI